MRSKKLRTLTIIRGLVAALAFGLLLPQAAPAQLTLGTSFNYQGKLASGGAPVTGTADLQFSLWDAEQNGGLVGSTVAINNAAVTNGLFSVNLDFGQAVFDGRALWVEIAVRSPAGSGSFTTLSPRQQLMATPYALQTRGLFVDASVNLGVGTTSPTQKLTVGGDAIIKGVQGYSNPFDTARLYLGDENASIRAFRGFGLRLSAFGAQDGVVLQETSGNVGIGTTTPQARLEVAGGQTRLEQEPWQTPTLTDGFVNWGGEYAPAGYFKDSLGVVHLRGLVRSGAAFIFTLPAGYRPAFRSIFCTVAASSINRVDVLSDGRVALISGDSTFVSLEGITFQASQ